MSKEILLVVESVSHEKGVSKDVLFGAIESALAVATKKRYGENAEFRVLPLTATAVNTKPSALGL